MNKTEIIEFINKHPNFYLGTAENDMPSVRVMQVCFINEKGIIFNTKKFKDSYRHLQSNPNVEMCFYDDKEETQVRISGKVEMVDDDAIRSAIVESHPVLNSLVAKEGLQVIVPYALKDATVKVWKRNGQNSTGKVAFAE